MRASPCASRGRFLAFVILVGALLLSVPPAMLRFVRVRITALPTLTLQLHTSLPPPPAQRKGSSSAAPPQAAKSSEVSPPQSRSKRTRAGSVEAQPPLSAQQLKPKRSTRNSPASPKPASARQIAQQKQQKLKAASGGHTAVTLSSRSPRPPASTGGWSTAPVSGATAQQLSSAAAAPVSRLSLDDAQDASGLGSHAASASALVGSASSAAPAVAVAPAAPVGGGHAVANARRSCMSMRTRCTSLFDEVIERSGDSIDRAAAVILRAVETDSLVHIFGGDGHSQLAAMELVRRPGALANFSSIFGPGLGLWERSTNLEGVSGIGQLTLAAHHVRSEDVVIVCSLHGLNAAAVDTAVASRERGCTVIALTCARHSSHMRSWSRTFGSKPGQQGGAQGRGGRSSSGKPSSKCEAEWSQATGRHPSRRSLSDCADILIDTNTADTNATGASAESGSASGSGSGSAFASETGIVVGGIGVGSLATIVS